jgi:transaldolase
MLNVSLLSQISKLLTVDVDSMDPEVAIRHTSSSFSFCDMTSNQAIVQGQATRPERAHVLECAINFVKSKGDDVSPEHMVDRILDVLVRCVVCMLRRKPV